MRIPPCTNVGQRHYLDHVVWPSMRKSGDTRRKLLAVKGVRQLQCESREGFRNGNKDAVGEQNRDDCVYSPKIEQSRICGA